MALFSTIEDETMGYWFIILFGAFLAIATTLTGCAHYSLQRDLLVAERSYYAGCLSQYARQRQVEDHHCTLGAKAWRKELKRNLIK